MSGVPVLSIIVMAPVAAALLIALFASNPKLPRVFALAAGTV